MKFLIDNALSPLLARLLESQEHDAIHVRDCGMHDAEDRKIFDCAVANEMVIISADTDFGTLLALQEQSKPSVILFRGGTPRRPEKQGTMLALNFPAVADALEKGAVATFESNRIRVRSLPIGRVTD